MTKKYRTVLLRILGLAFLFTAVGIFVLWDHFRVNRDFFELKTLLSNVRYAAITKNKVLIARFLGKDVVVRDRKTGMVIKSLNVPTLDEVNYDTTLGSDMILFSGRGTSEYNKREHGGDLRLKSWLGFKKYIAVNCTGLVTEGVYPAE